MFRKYRFTAVLSSAALLAACGQESTANAVAANAAAQSPVNNDSAATPAAPQGPLPSEIIRWGEAKRRLCAEAGGRATGAPRIHASADFNGDGRPDYFVGAHESFECSGQVLIYNDGPVATALWDFFLSTPRGYQLIEGAASDIEPITIRQFGGKPVAMVTCGGPGAYERPCDTYAFGWNGREMADVAFFIGGRQVNADGTRFGGGGWVTSGFPEIPQGFFSDGICWETARTDTEGMSYLYLTNRTWRQWDGPSPITRIERNGPVRYRFHLSIEDEEGNRTPSVVNIQTINAADFVVLSNGEGEEQNFSHCESNEVPASIRREWAGR